MATLKLIKGDTQFSIGFTITESDGTTAVDLTNATVIFKVGSYSSTLFSGECTVTDAEAGQCSYTVLDDELSSAGNYRGELQITWDSGKVLTAQDINVTIYEEL